MNYISYEEMTRLDYEKIYVVFRTNKRSDENNWYFTRSSNLPAYIDFEAITHQKPTLSSTGEWNTTGVDAYSYEEEWIAFTEKPEANILNWDNILELSLKESRQYVFAQFIENKEIVKEGYLLLETKETKEETEIEVLITKNKKTIKTNVVITVEFLFKDPETNTYETVTREAVDEKRVVLSNISPDIEQSVDILSLLNKK